jgi:hypothetical protein
MDKLDYYCHNNILNILRLKDQINYLSTCHIFYYNLTIEKLLRSNLNQKNIRNHIFRNISSLDVYNNRDITNVSFLKQLKILNASFDCGIDQNGIDGLDLVNLDAELNKKIVNVSFMKHLKILNASIKCGIDQSGIDGSDLIKLTVHDNNKITNVSFMKNLKYLDAVGNCGIDQHGINGLDLLMLYVNGNNKITNVSFMKHLKVLYSNDVDQSGRIRESRFSNSTCRLRAGYRRIRFN